jgi:hypothetical protein
MKRLYAGLALAGAAALAPGCAQLGPAMGGSTTPVHDARFGESVRQARALQTIDPEAGRSGNPVVGIDGRAGAAAIDRYHESFRTPPGAFDARIGTGRQ